MRPPWRSTTFLQSAKLPIMRNTTPGYASMVPACAMLEIMRDAEIIETELMEISGIADDTIN
jgi:hypothetical protein